MPKRHRSRSKPRPTAIDLFCGAGGLTEGLKQAGFKVIGAVEIDRVAVVTYRRNHRAPRVWQQDIRRLTVKAVMDELGLLPGQLDLLAGCPPCQGFSTMRTLNRGSSVEDSRNELVFQFLRFIRVLKPKAVMLENVPGLANDARMERFCERLHKLGYAFEKEIVNAADYGVPQRRRRMLLLANRVAAVTVPSALETRCTVRSAIESMPVPGDTSDRLHDLPETRAPHVLALIRKIPKDGGSRTALPDADQLDCHKATAGFYDVYGRMAWDAVAPTITSGCTNPSKGRFLHPTQDRAITLREAALLQTFPRKYFFSLDRGKEHAAAMIGNALPPRMIKVFAGTVKSDLRTAAAPTRKQGRRAPAC